MVDETGKLINPEVRIELTNRCNAHCITCPRQSLTRTQEDMDLGLFVEILEDAKELGAKLISLFGFGESLLHPKVSLFTTFATEYGFKTFLTTNGSLLNPEMGFRLLEAGLSDIRFSVHGLYGNYDKFHRGLDFNKTLHNIQSFIELRNAHKYDTRIHIVSMPINGDTVDDIVEFWIPFVDYLEIWEPHNWGGAKHFRSITTERKKTCGRPFSGPIQVQVDGSIIPCCFLTNNELVLGTMSSDWGIVDILTGMKYRHLRDCHTTGKLNGLACDTCDQLNMETKSPLLWSNRDPECRTDRTSSIKFKLA